VIGWEPVVIGLPWFVLLVVFAVFGVVAIVARRW
jgi:hypothetical protein